MRQKRGARGGSPEKAKSSIQCKARPAPSATLSYEKGTLTHWMLKGKDSRKYGTDMNGSIIRASRGNSRQNEVATAVHHSITVVIHTPMQSSTLARAMV